MKIIIQKVNFAKIFVNEKFKGEIGTGIVAYVDKLINLRIFNDESNKMNLSLKDVNGELLVVSNFTIYGNTKKGRRPSYTDSAPAEKAYKIYDLFLKKLEEVDTRVETGEFGEYMKIVSENDGPVNLIIDSQ